MFGRPYIVSVAYLLFHWCYLQLGAVPKRGKKSCLSRYYLRSSINPCINIFYSHFQKLFKTKSFLNFLYILFVNVSYALTEATMQDCCSTYLGNISKNVPPWGSICRLHLILKILSRLCLILRTTVFYRLFGRHLFDSMYFLCIVFM